MKRLLFLSPRRVVPANSGAKLREYCFLQALAKRAEIQYLCYHASDEEPLSHADLPFCRTARSVRKPGAYTVDKVVRGVTGKWPLPVLNYTSAEMIEAGIDIVKSAPLDAIHIEHLNLSAVQWHLAQAIGKQVGAIYNWHNIDSEVMRRYAGGGDGVFRKQYASYTARRLQSLEWQVLRTGVGHFVCSERERKQLKEIAPHACVEVLENGIDADYYAAAASADWNRDLDRCRLVFVGTMDYHPNVDGAVWFSREVWPAVWAQIPEAELAIVGARPTEAVKALGSLEGVTVTGTVPDVRPYYRGALAAVVPLRTGGGTRLKILEAMAAGVPVISTALGAEGLAVEAGRHVMIVGIDEPRQWAEALQELRKEAGLRERLIEEGRKLVRERYDWQVLGGRLVPIYEQWLEQRA